MFLHKIIILDLKDCIFFSFAPSASNDTKEAVVNRQLSLCRPGGSVPTTRCLEPHTRCLRKMTLLLVPFRTKSVAFESPFTTSDLIHAKIGGMPILQRYHYRRRNY